jgi:hypothetical protein
MRLDATKVKASEAAERSMDVVRNTLIRKSSRLGNELSSQILNKPSSGVLRYPL